MKLRIQTAHLHKRIEAKRSLEEFLYRRAEFVADTIVERLTPTLWPQLELSYPDDDEGEVS